MNFLSAYGLFLLKTITLVIAFLVVIGGICSIRRKSTSKITITSLSKQNAEIQAQMLDEVKAKKPQKVKKEKKKLPSLYVIDFNGDIKASQVEELRQIITAILNVAEEDDEVVIRLESPGGAVNSYGLAAAQLQRLRDKKIKLVVCVDKIAASGGYLMACVAHKILAAPFAIIGSIGVVAQIPNFHRWLKKNDIDVELLTAGEYKRTLTVFAENTEKGRQKFQEDLEKIHESFRNYLITYRTQIDINKVANGEYWLAMEAKSLNLIDDLITSDDYLLEKMRIFKVVHIQARYKRTLFEKLLQPATKLFYPWS